MKRMRCQSRVRVDMLVLILAMMVFGPMRPCHAVQYKILAIVNDHAITNVDLQRHVLPLRQQYLKLYAGAELDEKLAELDRTVLERLVEERLILSEAKGMDLKIDRKDINAKFDEIRGKFPSQEQFEISLEKQGMTTKDLKKQIEETITIQKLVSFFVGRRVNISDEDIRGFYDKNKHQFTIPGEYKVRHIFLKKDGADPLLLQTKLDELQDKLRKGGDFAELAKTTSDGPNAASGGSLGFVKPGQLQKELETPLMKLNVGSVSEVVTTDKGYHFLKLEAKKEPQAKALEDVQKKIEEILYRERMRDKRAAWIEELKGKHFVEYK